MAVTDHSEALDAATGLVARAHTKALVEARAQPDSTWIDAACAIGAAHAQLLAAHPGTSPVAPPTARNGIPAPRCSNRLSMPWRASRPGRARSPSRWPAPT
jgi:hypothetical protein